jgi:23S rRNA (guanine2445-N2)-methyltransferase / 23S rRNA (guanine2069-N7)-methyltransferase
MKFFASCGKGLEYLLADELVALGCTRATATMAGANAEGTLLDAQRVVLWSRLASRVLWPIAEFPCADEHALYRCGPSTDAASTRHHRGGRARLRRRDHPCALRAQQVRMRWSIARERERRRRRRIPDVRLNLVIRKGPGHAVHRPRRRPLHRRGWRRSQGESAAEGNLAAAVLLRGGWPQAYADGGDLLDPMRQRLC